MLKSRSILVRMALLAIVGSAAAVIVVSHSPQKELEAAYSRFNEALKRRDALALSDLLAPDFQETRMSGAVKNRSEAEAGYRKLAEDWVRFDSQKIEIDKITLKRAVATVIVNKISSGIMSDRAGIYGPKGKTHRATADTMDMDTWVRTGQGWKLKFRKIVMAEMSVDGQKYRSKGFVADADHH